VDEAASSSVRTAAPAQLRRGEAWYSHNAVCLVFVTSQATWRILAGEVRQADFGSQQDQGRLPAPSSPWPATDVQEVIQPALLEKGFGEPDELTRSMGERTTSRPCFRFGDKLPCSSRALGPGIFARAFFSCGFYPFHPFRLTCSAGAWQSLAATTVFGGATWRWVTLVLFGSRRWPKAIMDLPIGQTRQLR